MNIEYNVSQFIERNFPAIYRTEGPVFVGFVTKYFEYLEYSNNAVYHARRLMEYTDVDQTVDDFVVHLKEKYLKDVQFETVLATRKFIKNSLDLYRSKGTERAVDLFFRAVFGKPASVYYPGKDVFRLSDGTWIKPKYLEVTPTAMNYDLIGKQIVGITSGATAFVERYIRRRIDKKYVNILYLGAVLGNFETDEVIAIEDVPVTLSNPIVVGSLTTLDIVTGGFNFRVGDIVDLEGTFGSQGKGRVLSIETLTGAVEFELFDGGWGYTVNAEVIVSDKVLFLNNVSVADNNYSLNVFSTFEALIQPLANIEYELADGQLAVGDEVFRYYANNDQAGKARILSITEANAAAGEIYVAQLEGNIGLGETALFTTANAVEANTASYTDKTAVGNIVGYSTNATLRLVNTTSEFVTGRFAYQVNSSGFEIANGYIANAISSGAETTLLLDNVVGVFHNGFPVWSRTQAGANSSSNATLSFMEIRTGIEFVTSVFDTIANNRVYGNTWFTEGTVAALGEGSLAGFAIANTLTFPEQVALATDFIADYVDVELDAAAYGFPADPTANQEDIIIDCLDYANVVMGGVSFLIQVNPGDDYSYPPFVVIHEPLTSHYQRRDIRLSLANTTGIFTEGEVVEQPVGGKGIVKTANSSVAILKRITFANTFNTSNAVIGQSSGVTANVSAIFYLENTVQIGLNALVTTDVANKSNSVVTMAVHDSGFGYRELEEVSFLSPDGESSGTARVHLGHHGIGSGYFRNKKGWLSADKYLFDADYYQDFSYEVRTSIVVDKYREMLKNILHVAGMKAFSAIVLENNMETIMTAEEVDITQEG